MAVTEIVTSRYKPVPDVIDLEARIQRISSLALALISVGAADLANDALEEAKTDLAYRRGRPARY